MWDEVEKNCLFYYLRRSLDSFLSEHSYHPRELAVLSFVVVVSSYPKGNSIGVSVAASYISFRTWCRSYRGVCGLIFVAANVYVVAAWSFVYSTKIKCFFIVYW